MKIIFRADGNSQTGLGHMMRSAALMQLLQKDFECEFWTRNPEYFPFTDFQVSPVVKHLQFDSPLKEIKSFQQTASSSVFVLDGYDFNSAYQEGIKKAKFKLVCIDDIIDYHFLADVVINHAGGIDPASYSCEPYTKLYLGPQYSLIRPLFYKHPRPLRDFSDRQVLVSLGGADPNNITDLVLNSLTESGRFEKFHVVLGAANKNIEQLQQKHSGKGNVKFYEKLSGEEMYELMALYPYAVLSPSTICYEYMTMGGIVFLYKIADNQNRVREFFLKERLAVDFGCIHSVQDYAQMIKNQEKVFDGKAPFRIQTIFRELLDKNLSII